MTIRVSEVAVRVGMAKRGINGLEELGRLSGVTTATIRKYFRGEGFYSSTLEALAQALGVEALDLLVRDERLPFNAAPCREG